MGSSLWTGHQALDASGRMQAPAPCRAEIPETDFLSFNWRIVTSQYGAGSATHQHGSAICVVWPSLLNPLPV